MMAAAAEVDVLPEISWSHDVSWHESHGLMMSHGMNLMVS